MFQFKFTTSKLEISTYQYNYTTAKVVSKNMSKWRFCAAKFTGCWLLLKHMHLHLVMGCRHLAGKMFNMHYGRAACFKTLLHLFWATYTVAGPVWPAGLEFDICGLWAQLGEIKLKLFRQDLQNRQAIRSGTLQDLSTVLYQVKTWLVLPIPIRKQYF